MNREILFRGFSIERKEWVYGSLVVNPFTKECGIIFFDAIFHGVHHTVAPETVGQFTGLRDKNGTMVFEGDILKNHMNHKGVVNYSQRQAYFCVIDSDQWADGIRFGGEMINVDGDYWKLFETSVIGNIIDNPELLESI